MSAIAPTRVVKGAFIVHADPDLTPKRINFEYNPVCVQRSLTFESTATGIATGSAQLRPKGQPVETISFEIEFDSNDQIDQPGRKSTANLFGVYPQLAAIETTIRQQKSVTRSQRKSPYVLLSLGINRIMPVQLISYSVTEQEFDSSLNPIRAKASVSMRVLTANDFAQNHPARKVYLDYLKKLEEMATIAFELGQESKKARH